MKPQYYSAVPYQGWGLEVEWSKDMNPTFYGWSRKFKSHLFVLKKKTLSSPIITIPTLSQPITYGCTSLGIFRT